MIILPPFNHSILVLGDGILDEYLIGRATRLSREAAVPVLERTRRQLIPGGACAPAVGVVALGGRATLAGVVGEDDAAAALRRVLDERGVAADGLLADPSRPTTVKTRIIAEGGFVYGQHLARIDYLERHPLDKPIEEQIVKRLQALAPAHDVLLLSDYKNGVITPSLLDRLCALRREINIPLVADSQGDLEHFHGFDLVKCNRAEAEAFLEVALAPADEAARRAALAALRERTAARAVVVTLGGEGIAWQDDTGYGETKAPRADVYDVTGAGDTVIAVLALAHAARLTLAQGCALAAHAAALTVRVMGNYAPTRDELAASLTRLKGSVE
jgi:D-glycero-beta-D-manno-heptose-7-phosphate kinase